MRSRTSETPMLWPPLTEKMICLESPERSSWKKRRPSTAGPHLRRKTPRRRWDTRLLVYEETVRCGLGVVGGEKQISPLRCSQRREQL